MLLRRVHRVVKEHESLRSLHNLGWRTHAREPLGCTIECRIRLVLVLRQVFYFSDQLRFIRREIRSLGASLQFSSLFPSLIRGLLLALCVVRLPVRTELSLRDGVTPP